MLASLLSPALFAATWPAADVAYYSNDKVTWHEAELVTVLDSKHCVAGELHGCETFKNVRQAVILFNEKPVVEPLYFRITADASDPPVTPPTEPEEPTVPDPDPVDPEPPAEPANKCLVNPTSFSGPALRSPPDRLVNLITAGDSAFGTAQRIREDKDELMPRIDELYRIISEVVRCEKSGDSP